MRIKRALAWTVAKTLYVVGDLACKTCYLIDTSPPDGEYKEPGRIFSAIFWVIFQTYQRCMHASADVSEWGDAGLWKRVSE